ncbi:putative gnat family protein [Rosellinia necatrix]|uniref:Putative gnat family protein n=1 Tax=Rosellinia necatrix TaxID=77044 RepID=A0A1W2TD25_ROSNE|nr:putative gnat family protein [Rosellinia necatrix]
MALPFSPPASLDPAFTISRPTAADIDALARVYFDSFATDPGNTWWWSPDRGAMFEWLHARVLKKMSDRGVRHFQIVDGGGDGGGSSGGRGHELVAFARWDIPKGYEDRFGAWLDPVGGNGGGGGGAAAVVETADGAEEPKATVATAPVPRGADMELCQYFFTKLAGFSKRWNADEMLGLSLLCTSPKYFRRGAAMALLAPMLAIADAAGLRSYLEATPAGRPLYEKLGFRAVETHLFDPAPITGGRVQGGSAITIMIRDPQPL